MTSDDLLGEAIDKLYSADPEEFTQRRGDLVARARSAGQAAVARQIAALRKPTRSAWVINQLARSDPDAASRLAELGDELRAAERSRDGSSMRELSQARRRLIAALVRQALTVAGQHEAPAAMREDITATLAAALADPEVAEQIRHGTLLRPARRAGFGTAQAPALALVPPPDTGPAGARAGNAARAGPAASQPATDTPRAKAGRAPAEAARDQRAMAEAERDLAEAGQTQAEAEQAQAEADRDERATAEAKREQAETERAETTQAETTQAKATQAEAERERAEAERERRQARADTEQALADADQAAQAARTAEQELTDDVRRAEQQLADLRRRLHEARARARQAGIAQRKARQVLSRLPELPE